MRLLRSLDGYAACAALAAFPLLASCGAPEAAPPAAPPAATAPPPATARWEERPALGSFFQQAGVEGAFVLYEPDADHYVVYNRKRAEQRFPPASTFKILNALIALETGVIQDENEVIPWDGVERRVPEWNRDHTLASGMTASAVWFYQEIARRVGEPRMRAWVTRVGYGNADIGGGIDRFWLDGNLRISPVEEIRFLTKLVRGQLPFSERSQSIVKRILIRDQGEGYVLRFKTGWQPPIGWLVGWLERGGKAYVFATNIDIHEDKDAEARVTVTRAILTDLGLLPQANANASAPEPGPQDAGTRSVQSRKRRSVDRLAPGHL